MQSHNKLFSGQEKFSGSALDEKSSNWDWDGRLWMIDIGPSGRLWGMLNHEQPGYENEYR